MSNDFFGRLNSWSHTYGFVTGDFFGAFTGASTAHINRGLYDLLHPKVPAIIQNSQVFNVGAQQNLARIGAPMPVLYGKFRIYPDLLTQAWSEYIDNQEYLYQLMTVTQGQAQMLSLLIGDTPIESFADVTYQLYQPGETVDLFHNNVFSNDQVQDLTLTKVGAGTAAAALTYDATAHTITSASAIFTEDLFKVGNRVGVTGSLHNNGIYTIGFISADFKQLVITGVLIDESPTQPDTYCTITNGSKVYGPARFNVIGATHKFNAYDPVTDGVNLSAILVGDRVTVTGSQLNDGIYTVASVDAGGTYITVVETVTPETAVGTPSTIYSRVELVSQNVGPYYANRSGQNISAFSVDIVFPKGFYRSDDAGNLANSTATLNIEWRKIGDSTWTLGGAETFTAAKNEAQRYTKTYTLPPATNGIIEVRVMRTNDTANSNREVNESHWAGLRGFVLPPATIPANYDGPTAITNEHYQYADRTTLAIKVRATGQLSNAMSKQFNGVFQRLIPTWDGTAWTGNVSTSSIAWAFADVITNSQYGIGRPTSVLNVDELLALDTLWSTRGDQFNGYFDQEITAFDALKMIARCGRADAVFDGHSYSMIRDEQRTLRAAMFTDQNTTKDSVVVNFDFKGQESPQGFLVSYWDANTYVAKTILCGVDVNTQNTTLIGCTSRQQAWNEGNYMLAVSKYRSASVSFGSEMEGFIPRNGDLITLQTQLVSWGQSARVLAQSGLTLTLDQSLDWSGTGFVCKLRDVDGTPSASISCSRGSADNQLVLASLPAFTIQTDGSQERTHISLGTSASSPNDLVVTQVSAQNEYNTSIQGVVDDARVYADPGTAPAEPGMPPATAFLFDGSRKYDGSETFSGVK